MIDFAPPLQRVKPLQTFKTKTCIGGMSSFFYIISMFFSLFTKLIVSGTILEPFQDDLVHFVSTFMHWYLLLKLPSTNCPVQHKQLQHLNSHQYHVCCSVHIGSNMLLTLIKSTFKTNLLLTCPTLNAMIVKSFYDFKLCFVVSCRPKWPGWAWAEGEVGDGTWTTLWCSGEILPWNQSLFLSARGI